MKMNEILIHGIAWINLKAVILNKKKPREKSNTYYVI